MIKPAGIVGALVAAVVGAVAWALVAKFMNVEFGYLAWGIGAAVGFLSNRLGSSGVGNGVLCAVLALASIAVGKVWGYQWSAESDIAELYSEQWTSQETFIEMQTDASEFEKVTAEKDYPKYMIDRAYSDAVEPSQVAAEDLAAFKEDTVPRLKWMSETHPDYEAWRTRVAGEVEAASKTAAAEDAKSLTLQDYINAARDDLGVIDILFAVLGVASAFVLGKGSDEPKQKDPPIVLTGPTPTDKPSEPPA